MYYNLVFGTDVGKTIVEANDIESFCKSEDLKIFSLQKQKDASISTIKLCLLLSPVSLPSALGSWPMLGLLKLHQRHKDTTFSQPI